MKQRRDIATEPCAEADLGPKVFLLGSETSTRVLTGARRKRNRIRLSSAWCSCEMKQKGTKVAGSDRLTNFQAVLRVDGQNQVGHGFHEVDGIVVSPLKQASTNQPLLAALCVAGLQRL